MAQVVGEPHEEAQFLDAQVRPHEVVPPLPGVSGLDERLEHVERGALDPVAEQEALGPRELLQRRDQPQEEAVVGLYRRAGLPCTVRFSGGFDRSAGSPPASEVVTHD